MGGTDAEESHLLHASTSKLRVCLPCPVQVNTEPLQDTTIKAVPDKLTSCASTTSTIQMTVQAMQLA